METDRGRGYVDGADFVWPSGLRRARRGRNRAASGCFRFDLGDAECVRPGGRIEHVYGDRQLDRAREHDQDISGRGSCGRRPVAADCLRGAERFDAERDGRLDCTPSRLPIRTQKGSRFVLGDRSTGDRGRVRDGKRRQCAGDRIEPAGAHHGRGQRHDRLARGVPYVQHGHVELRPEQQPGLGQCGLRPRFALRLFQPRYER